VDAISQILPYTMLHDYLCGVDRLKGTVMGFPFEAAAPAAIQGAAGAETTVSFNKVESYENLATALSVDAKAKARYGLFSADAELDFERSMSMNSYSLYVYASAKVERAFTQVADPKYKSDAAALVKQAGGAKAFRTAYGDWFVRGIATGGEILSLIEIRTKDQQDRESIDANMKGAYGGMFSAEVDVKKTFSEAIGNASTQIFQHQVGGTPRHIKDAGEVFDAIKAFVDELAAPDCNTARAHQVGCVPYETVPIPGAPSWLDVEQAEQSLDVLADLRIGHVRVLADIQYVLTNQDEFTWDSGAEPKPEWVRRLNDASRIYAENIKTIQRVAGAIAKDLTVPMDLDELIDIPDLAMPPRSPGAVKPEEMKPEEVTTPPEPTSLKDSLAASRAKLGAAVIDVQGPLHLVTLVSPPSQ
jgi:hypothetical protein